MGEIEREGKRSGDGIIGSNEVEIILKRIGPSPSSRLFVPSSIKVFSSVFQLMDNRNSISFSFSVSFFFSTFLLGAVLD